MNTALLKESILNKWIEFSGGSRPGTNMLRFQVMGETIQLQIRYVFDWETMETGDMAFDMSIQDFEHLIDQLSKEGAGHLTLHTANQDLDFEWRLLNDKILFRLEGTISSAFEGTTSYRSPDYQQLLGIVVE